MQFLAYTADAVSIHVRAERQYVVCVCVCVRASILYVRIYVSNYDIIGGIFSAIIIGVVVRSVFGQPPSLTP